MTKKRMLVIILVAFFALTVFLFVKLLFPYERFEPKELTYQEFLERGEIGDLKAVYYDPEENKLYGMLLNSPFKAELLPQSYDFWVEDVFKEQLWADMRQYVEEKKGSYGFFFKFES